MLQSRCIVSELRLQSELLGQSTASLDSGSSTQRRAGARASMASHSLGAPAKAKVARAKAEVNIMYVVMIVCVCLLPSSEPKSYHGSIALV